MLAYSQNDDPQQQGQAQLEQIEQARKQLAEEITAIAENENRQASDYHSMAETIAAIGEASKQQGQVIPELSLFDGLHAVDLGEELNPLETDWPNLRERLEALLEQPPQQEDEQNQDGESEDEQSDSDQQNKDGNEDQNSEDKSDESGENQQTPEQDENQPDDQSEPQGEDEAENDPSGEEDRQQKDPSKSPNKEHGGVGDLEDSPNQPELDQQQPQPAPQPQQAPMQQVGGVKEEHGEQTARQAMAQQIMDQLKQQDDPGKLFMLMQQAEDGTTVTVPKNRKDW